MKPRRITIASDDTGHDAHDVEATTEDRSSNRRSPGRPLVRPLVILALTAVGAYAIAAVALNVLVDTDRVREWVAPRASALLNRPVSTGDARVALLPRPSIHVADVRVDNLDDFDGPALAFAERVRLDVRLLPLLIGRVTVHRVQVDGPRFYLGVDENGTSNFGDLIPSGAGTSEALETPVVLGVGQLAVSDATVSYFNAPAGRSFTISGADAEMNLAADGAVGWRADISAESDSLLARMATVTEEILHLEGPRATLTARSDGAGRTIQIDDGSVELSGETLSIRGRVTGLANTRPSYDLQLTNDSMDAGVLAALLPASVRSSRMPVVDGRLGITFQVTRARSARPPLVRGSLHLADVGVHLSGMTYVDALTGTVGVTPDTVVLDSLTGRFADGPFEVSGTVARSTRAMALAVRALPDLDALDQLGLVPEGTTLSGDADLDLSLAGHLGAPDSIAVAGVVTLEGLQAKLARFGVPFYVPAGELTLASNQVSWTDLPVLLGQDEVVTTGRLAGVLVPTSDPTTIPYVEATVRGARVDLGSVLPTKEDAPDATYGHMAFAHLGDRPIAGRPAPAAMAELGLSRPRSLPVHGTVDVTLDTLDFRRHRLTGVSARIELADTSLVVEAPSFEMWNGTSTASLELRVGDAAAEPFSLSLTSEGGSADAIFAALTPIQDGVEGTLDLDFEASGALDRSLLPMADELQGRARVAIYEGRLHETGPNLVVADFLGSDDWTDVLFTTWETELELIGRRLEVESSALSGDEGRVSFRGLVQMDGTADLSLGLSIPPDRLGTVSL
ncbi:MAG: AsmA-like C-terminal region-containing protein, partial [Gemmatimonadota bacterium]